MALSAHLVAYKTASFKNHSLQALKASILRLFCSIAIPGFALKLSVGMLNNGRRAWNLNCSLSFVCVFADQEWRHEEGIRQENILHVAPKQVQHKTGHKRKEKPFLSNRHSTFTPSLGNTSLIGYRWSTKMSPQGGYVFAWRVNFQICTFLGCNTWSPCTKQWPQTEHTILHSKQCGFAYKFAGGILILAQVLTTQTIEPLQNVSIPGWLVNIPSTISASLSAVLVTITNLTWWQSLHTHQLMTRQWLLTKLFHF